MKKMMAVLEGQTLSPPPIWMMRQAGRYLPEYKEKRKETGSFLDLCYTPEAATEVTLQPIRRFGFDASILFSDILVIPHALGRDLRFEEGCGPLMTPIHASEVSDLKVETAIETLSPVYETVSRLRANLPSETTLIGFCGAPWTVATYIIAGHGTPDQAPGRLFAYQNPEAFDALLAMLAETSAQYLMKQLDAGADCVQIFDSWSGVLDTEMFERASIKPIKRIVDAVRAAGYTQPIIGFPKGAGTSYNSFVEKTGVTAIGIDWTVSMEQAKHLQTLSPIQGNLDPMRLVAGGNALKDGVARILNELSDGPLIFNLGHGITPQTPIDHVQAMIDQVRAS